MYTKIWYRVLMIMLIYIWKSITWDSWCLKLSNWNHSSPTWRWKYNQTSEYCGNQFIEPYSHRDVKKRPNHSLNNNTPRQHINFYSLQVRFTVRIGSTLNSRYIRHLVVTHHVRIRLGTFYMAEPLGEVRFNGLFMSCIFWRDKVNHSTGGHLVLCGPCLVTLFFVGYFIDRRGTGLINGWFMYRGTLVVRWGIVDIVVDCKNIITITSWREQKSNRECPRKNLYYYSIESFA